ncbi:MAG: xanthine dehydrogenase YagS FAD-binding subunit, partial [Alphaproteobacteria bacterium]|nr:xanthine dehydrogenase YagS FAD-binding subunit [Alphaproteobacteria bacterium]
MIPFTYRAAHSEQDAIEAVLAGGRYIAGGTTLIDLMREEVERPDQLIDINALALRHIRSEPDRLVIGALARMADVASDPVTSQVQPMLVEALVEGASPQLRNMASIGGNLLQRVRCPYLRTLDAACNKRTPALVARRSMASTQVTRFWARATTVWPRTLRTSRSRSLRWMPAFALAVRQVNVLSRWKTCIACRV